MASELEIAWAAGLFEGEGSIGIYTPHDRHHVLPFIRLQVQMTDRDVVERFYAVVGCGSVSPELRFGRPQHKPTYRWLITKRSEVERILLLFWPWFGERRRQRAEEALVEIRRLDRTCDFCGETFRAQRSIQRFCSVKHRNLWHYYSGKRAA